MKKGDWRRLLIVLGILTLLMAVGGCRSKSGSGSQSAAGHKNIKIFLSLNEMDTFRKTLVDAASAKATEEGVQLDVADAQGSIEAQVEQLKRAASRGYDVIVCSAVSVDTAVQLKMSAGEIPIVFFNSCPEDKHLEAGKYVYVGSNEQVAGQFQAEYVLTQMPGKQEINVVLIKGPRYHSATTGRTNGVKQVLESSGKKINYVFEDSANWDTEQAKELFALFLRTGVEADCVICNNDAMALGVLEAGREVGMDFGAVPVLGVDATADGCAAIRSGEMAFTVYQSGKGQGEAIVEMAIRMAGGGDTKDMQGISEDGKYVWVDFEKVDSGNVSLYGQ